MSVRVHPDSFHWPAGVLALLVHGAFFALLYFGINWRVEAPQGMVVDIWESLPEPAKAQETKMPEISAPEIRPAEESLPPAPLPPIAPVKPLPPPKPAQADIVLDKSKALKAKRAEQVKQAQAEREKQAQLKREQQLQIEKERLAQVEREKQTERDKQSQLEREKVQAERIKQVQAEREQQAQLERDKQDQATRERQAQVQAERQAQLEREKQAQAEQATAIGKVMAEYIGKIQTKIRRNIVLPPGVPDNAKVVFDVTLLPGGAVLSARLSATSGSRLYDSAVERAILKAHTLPVPSDPALFNRFRELRLTFCPKEELCK